MFGASFADSLSVSGEGESEVRSGDGADDIGGHQHTSLKVREASVSGAGEGEAAAFDRQSSEVTIRRGTIEEGGQDGGGEGSLDGLEGRGVAIVDSLDKLPFLLEAAIKTTVGRLGIRRESGS